MVDVDNTRMYYHNDTLFISTTSFLTATTLIYAIGAGITAAAGTETCPPIDSQNGLYLGHHIFSVC